MNSTAGMISPESVRTTAAPDDALNSRLGQGLRNGCEESWSALAVPGADLSACLRLVATPATRVNGGFRFRMRITPSVNSSVRVPTAERLSLGGLL